jgi:magnesium-transporting ATPase (P-type)
VVAAAPDRRSTLERGLTASLAAARLADEGPNILPSVRPASFARRFGRQVVHMFALMLWVAAGLAVVAGLPELGAAIVVVVLLNAAFSFVQESRADRAADRLREMLPARVTVRRDGRRVDVDAAEVVRGDVLVLSAGDRVPADADVVRAHALLVDTSLLTGESEPVGLDEGSAAHAGTFVIEGEGEAVVTATGAATGLAEIARMTTAGPKPMTPLTRALHRTVRLISTIAVGVGLLFFLVALALGRAPSDGFIFAIGVTVALVPEALLPTVTLSLAWGAEQMAHRQVLVRRLDAVETLGSTTFICTDKTGTLTRNEMSVVEAWTPAGTARVRTPGYRPTADVELSAETARPAVTRLADAAARCSSGYVTEVAGTWRAHGDPMEAALDAFARRVGLVTAGGRARPPGELRFPFDPRRRRMSVAVDGTVLVKGAPDAVLPRCLGADLAAAEAAVSALSRRGLRLLAVGGRAAGPRPPATADEAERDLELYGLLALEDPPRPDVGAALEACRSAGITVAMVTGDHPATAATIGTEVGLRRAGDPVLLGEDLPGDDAALGVLLDRPGVVVARVSPEQKLRIARALRARGHVVAMTGDGVNDGPALHEANIGIAMGLSGTDVAREAADLVLLDDHFASIVSGVEQGRATYVNIRRFLTYHLTDNVAELTPFVVWMLSGGRFPLALGVLQILALDIGTDTLSATALGAEPPARHLLRGPPVSGSLMNGTVVRRAFGLLGPTVAAGAMLAFVVSLAAAGWRPGADFPSGQPLAAASGAAFMTVVLAQTANAFACRSSTRWPGTLGWRSNRLLIPAASVELAFAVTVLLVPAIAARLGHASPPAAGWLVGVGAAALVLGVDWTDKRVRASRRRVRGPSRAPRGRAPSGARGGRPGSAGRSSPGTARTAGTPRRPAPTTRRARDR